jgi:3-hydroxyacyl-[acyl-carrier-protein] dehydratase
MNGAMDIQEVQRFLPHRYPFLLIDRVLECVPGEKLTAFKNVTVNEPYFQGHFPHYPVMPGVLILEAMAQACALLAARTEEAESLPSRVYLFAGADGVRFKRPVLPGDRLDFEVRMLRRVRRIWRCGAQTLVEGKLCSEAEVMFTYKDM